MEHSSVKFATYAAATFLIIYAATGALILEPTKRIIEERCLPKTKNESAMIVLWPISIGFAIAQKSQC